MATITEVPFCHVLSPEMKEVYCDQCFVHREVANLKRCSSCKVVRYCSASCQREAWTLHKTECKALKGVAPKIPTCSVLLLYRLVLLYNRGKLKEKHSSVFGDRSFQDLMSHTDHIKNDPQRVKDLGDVMGTLKIYAADTLELPTSAELLDMFGKMVINSFTICDPELQALGVGIYLGASHLDHSCVPNAVPTFSGIRLQISRTDGASFQYSQTFISYTDQLGTIEERQTELRSSYYFTCQCVACENTTQDEEKSSTLCPTLNCQSNIRQDKSGQFRLCSECGKKEFPAKYASEKQSILKDVQQTLKEVKDLRKKKDHSEVLCRSKACLCQCRKLFPTINISRCRLEEQAFDACVNLGQWEESIEYGVNTLQCYRKFYDPFHPNLGITLMKLGKIDLFLGHLHKATRYLQEAETILKKTHGADHSLYSDLTSLLHQCLEEQRVNLEFEH